MKSSHFTSFNKAIGVSFYLLFSSLLVSAPMQQNQVIQAARGWLKQNPAPMERGIGKHSDTIQAFHDQDGQILYYVVPLKPEGFVILSADDEIEPVIAFSQTGFYDAAEGNPLKDLLEKDMGGRLDFVKKQNEIRAKSKINASNINLKKQKWQSLSEAGIQQAQDKGDIQAASAGITSISDVRVEPFIQTKWSQGDVNGSPCYNYYTPNNYPTGCVATVMAQLMRYHSWPTAGIGVLPFEISIDGTEYTYFTRGGNGSGGAYDWTSMVYDPQAGGLTTIQRQAIGALCYDAGLSVNMDYTSSGSGAATSDADTALVDTFGYSNSIYGYVFATYVNNALTIMMYPNLDAGLPVILSISSPGHAVLADGYGYDDGTMYHHLNMGWGGLDDAWYQLPPDTSDYTFTVINACVYNVYPSGTGEIVSGRVTSMAGAPLDGVAVTAYQGSTPVKQTTTNSRGIYALTNLPSNTTFTISAVKSGYAFVDQSVSTGKSVDWGTFSGCGNRWAVDFAATNPMPPTAIDQTVDANSLSSIIIELQALDDHLPNPPDQIQFTITSLPGHGTLSEPNVGDITTAPYPMATDANSVQYTPCPYFGGQDSFTFIANDGGTAPTGGDSNFAMVTLNVDNTLKSNFGLDGNVSTNTMLDTSFYACRSQVLYLSSDIGSAKKLTDLAINLTTLPPFTLNDWTIRMQHTNMTQYDDVVGDFLTSGWTIVYQTDWSPTQTGWINFHFQTPFQYNGTQNLLIDFSFNNTSTSSGTGWYLFKDVGDVDRTITIKSSNPDHTDPLTWDFWAGDGYYWGGGWLPSIKLIGTIPIDPVVGDFDLSCDVKMPDLALLSAAWATSQGDAGYNSACDISSPKDNLINLADLIVFAEQWLQIYPQ